MRLYTVHIPGRVGLFAAKHIAHVRRKSVQQFGKDNVLNVRRATEADVIHARQMGGTVPAGKVDPCESRSPNQCFLGAGAATRKVIFCTTPMALDPMTRGCPR